MTRYALTLVALLLAGCNQPERLPLDDSPRPPAETIMGNRAQDRALEPVAADPFEVETLDGRVLRSSELIGKVVLVNFWATWCGPCLEEMPDLAELYRSLASEKFEMIGAALEDDDTEAIRAYTESIELPYPVVIDDGSLADALGGVYMMPTTYLMDKEGRVVHRVIGVVDPDSIRADVEKLLGD